VFANPFGRTDITVRQAADDVAGQQIGVRTEELVEDEWLLNPAVLQQLALFEPAARLAEREPNAQVVLLIDGLDELRHGPAARGWTVLDWLAQCPRLPDNVRIVATSRHDEDLLQEYRIRQRERLRELRVTSTSSQVAEDLCDYARRLATDTTLSRPLAEVGFALSEVAHAAAKRAAGNFLYLVSWARGLAHAVASGRTDDLLAIAELNSLPAGLDELYGLFVLLVHKNAGADWVAIHRPVLEVLAVARGPLSVPQIALLAGIPEAEPHVKCALADMPQLLHTDNGRSRFFHASLADYLTTPELPNRRPQDFVEAPMVHRQLAARILETYGQRWETCTDDYATANVAHHLVSALRGDQPDDQHRWCATALVELLADSAFVRRLTTVVGVVRVLAEFADAHGALRARFAAAADQIAHALAVHCVLMVSGGRLTADVLQAGLGYRRDFTEFLDRVLEHTADSSFVDETVSTMDRPGLESGAVWADFATVQASRFRRRNDFVRADRLLDRIVDWGDQAKALYERGYLYHLTGRVDEAIRCLGRASDLSRQAGHESGAWIGALVRDQIAFLADRLDAETYRDTLLAGLEFFVGASQNGSPHARRWIMNVHYKLLNRASLLQDPHSARDAWHALRDDDWARIERPDLLLVWEGRMALTCGEWQRAVDRYTQLLGPDALVAAPPDQEFIAWYLLEFGRSLAATGRTSEATLAWQQVLRCPDTTAAWPWKPRARALLSGHSGQ
jgi:tetratricopeptide (TPR) repeat protein